ncbi:ubiquitin-protein ligase (Hul4), putative [Trichophyton verrucosum HKI 0517]|uniref:HECT-type E3 ubiquitin transferase n=1 Tax=Trichophyton verrucosum (strain HKI 0517) TaxID=663202 RepID=D4D0M5_TRIVH|nr:ubiquitin-protein ligase (Hul4), putative [Trichophyton verrucosum HKI 0517]EFE44604.1 ubiquitin-protein ligase (Hul4), putative [Trichophyton verrucosum HKI 0517]
MAPTWVSRFTHHNNRPANAGPPAIESHPAPRPSSSLDPSTLLLPPDQSTTQSRAIPVRRGHSRSTSNPFPAFFAGKGRKARGGSRDIIDSESTDGEDGLHPVITNARSCSPQKRAGSDNHMEEYRKRKSADCGVVSQMKNCIQIIFSNPKLEVSANQDQHLVSFAHFNIYLAVTVEETRRIIEECLISFLSTQLGEQRVRQARPKTDHSGPGQDEAELSKQPVYPQSDKDDTNMPSVLVSDVPSTSGTSPQSKAKVDNLGLPYTPTNDARDIRLDQRSRDSGADVKGPTTVFRALEQYITTCFDGCDTLNNSFITGRTRYHRAASEGSQQSVGRKASVSSATPEDHHVSNLDEKTILLGNFAENASWWAESRRSPKSQLPNNGQSSKSYGTKTSLTNSKSPRINWPELLEWYHLVIHAGDSWNSMILDLPDMGEQNASPTKELDVLAQLNEVIMESRFIVRKTLLRATEKLLQRPKRPLIRPDDTRFLLILIENPLLYSSGSMPRTPSGASPSTVITQHNQRPPGLSTSPYSKPSPEKSSRLQPSAGGSELSSLRYSALKRIFGLISNLPNECHHSFVGWFSRLMPSHFQRLVEVVNGFVTFRLGKSHKRQSAKAENGLNLGRYVPTFSAPGTVTHAQLHTALQESPEKSPASENKLVSYADDWQIRAAARVMALLFRANGTGNSRKVEGGPSARELSSGSEPNSNRLNKIPINYFYNARLDYADLILDFEAWESRSGKFSFCQYSFLLSIWAKIQIMEHDARRQMEAKAREAFFDTILGRRGVSQYLVLKVRRDCLAEDSLQSVSSVIGSAEEDIKKGLRIEFAGEEGIDAGGLRKEWFLLLVREVFDPLHANDHLAGLFLYDEDSQYCYFNPYCFESSEQFFLVGVVLGLAIYNSTILDIALPPFAFRKLLAYSPSNVTPTLSSPPQPFKPTLDDLAEFRPALAKGLRQLLEYDGDVAGTFCQDFVVQVERYGETIQVPLCAGGENQPVTNENRREFVDLYVRYIIDGAVCRQFEPFRRGFFTVCGGNALHLFKPEEIELLIRGSEEPLDIPSLRGVAMYEHWPASSPDREPVVNWFWDFFERIPAKDQRKILSFITGSDRLPAMGAVNLVIRLMCLGPDSERFPTARTCFNALGLYRYKTRQKFEEKLWRAVVDSEGFGLQ